MGMAFSKQTVRDIDVLRDQTVLVRVDYNANK